MKIEIGKKYKTRNGENVVIQRIAFDRAYGVIECAYESGLFAIWDSEGYPIETEMMGLHKGSLDLVEVKEDWEVLVEHFENKGKPVFIVFNNEVCLCADMKQCEYSREHCKLLLAIRDEGYHSNIRKEKIKIATLEDCKKYILEK